MRRRIRAGPHRGFFFNVPQDANDAAALVNGVIRREDQLAAVCRIGAQRAGVIAADGVHRAVHDVAAAAVGIYLLHGDAVVGIRRKVERVRLGRCRHCRDLHAVQIVDAGRLFGVEDALVAVVLAKLNLVVRVARRRIPDDRGEHARLCDDLRICRIADADALHLNPAVGHIAVCVLAAVAVGADREVITVDPRRGQVNDTVPETLNRIPIIVLRAEAVGHGICAEGEEAAVGNRLGRVHLDKPVKVNRVNAVPRAAGKPHRQLIAAGLVGRRRAVIRRLCRGGDRDDLCGAAVRCRLQFGKRHAVFIVIVKLGAGQFSVPDEQVTAVGINVFIAPAEVVALQHEAELHALKRGGDRFV